MLRVRDCMTADVVTLKHRTTVREAMEILASYHIGGAPVLDGPRLVGVVSAADLLQFAASLPVPEGESRRLERLGRSDGDDEVGERGVSTAALLDAALDDGELALDVQLEQPDLERDVLDVHAVDEIMTTAVLSIGADEPVVAAADVMCREGVHRLLVLDGDSLAGIITTTDLARAVADRRLIARTFVFPRGAAT
jgi:CBS domain-containing protein